MQAAARLASEKAPYPRISAPCPVFGVCGGCALQDLAYEHQLALKRQRLEHALASLGAGLPLELVGLEEPWRYRNKAELTFGQTDGRLTLGYHAAGSFWKVVDLDDCLLLPQPLWPILHDVRRLAQETGLPAYQPRTHQGFFRYLLVRHSHATGRSMVCVMTAPGPDREAAGRALEAMAAELRRRHPDLASVYWGLTDRVADVAQPEELRLLAGEAYLEDRMGPFRLQLHPLSFLQPVSRQADRLYRLLGDSLGAGEDRVAWDLYCGVGLIAFYLSACVRKVYAVDVEPHHLELARANAALNGLSNIEFRMGKVEDVLQDRRFWLQEAKPDLIVVDPPRAGLHQAALSSLLAARPRQIAYLSCNVQSLVRDLQQLLSGFPRYRLTRLAAFDMFPQTNHAEVFALLQRP